MQNLLAFNIGDELKLNQLNPASGIGTAPGFGSIGEIISRILPNVYVFASLILFVLIIVGGFAIITSGPETEKKGQGSKALTGAILGFGIIFVSIWLIKLIEFLTGIKIFDSGL